jgi:molybdate transport system ATP-binding protein
MIEINITKKLHGAYGHLDLQVNTQIRQGEFVAIYGPSGAGKTSILRMLAGLTAPDHGRILVDDAAWFDHTNRVNMRPQERSIGMVFQNYSLFPNMTVRENLAYALQKGQATTLVDELLEATELTQLADRKPILLSGGQQQRVALARALVRKPRLLLLDEPLSAVDLEMQAKLQDYILRIHENYQLTTILVSHDLLEVVKMAQRVLVLEDGQVKKDGAPLSVLPVQLLASLTGR